jgi:hypothetical protein
VLVVAEIMPSRRQGHLVVGGLLGADHCLVGHKPGGPNAGAQAAVLRPCDLRTQPQVGASLQEPGGFGHLGVGDRENHKLGGASQAGKASLCSSDEVRDGSLHAADDAAVDHDWPVFGGVGAKC